MTLLSLATHGALYPVPPSRVRGRFAPSPSGRMHLGNVYAALLSRLSAKARGGEWVLRIEDNDPGRSRREWAEWIMDDLAWLGLTWDGEPVWQSQRMAIYDECLRRLSAAGLLYPCRCTRAELATAAPHESDGMAVYNGKCRPAVPCYEAYDVRDAALRLRVTGGGGFLAADAESARETNHGGKTAAVPSYRVSGGQKPAAPGQFTDTLCGPQCISLPDACGDFVVRRKDGAIAYQLACAVDDALTGITEVVRGDDLLRSTAMQRHVQQLLGLTPPAAYAHLPLLRDAEGRRLSKRDQSLSMQWLRAHSTPHDVLAQVCRMAGLDAERVL